MGLRVPHMPSIINNAKQLVGDAGRAYNWLDGGGKRTIMMNGKQVPLQRGEVPWGPGGNAGYLKDLANLIKTGKINSMLGKTGLSLRSVSSSKYHPDEILLNHMGNPRDINAIKSSMYLEPGEKAHLLQLVSNDLRHAKPGQLHPDQIAGSFITSSSKEYGLGTLQQGFIKEPFRGKGISGEALKARKAQVINHLGFNPAFNGGLSPDALKAYMSAVNRGIIKPAPEMLDQMIRHASGRPGVPKSQADALWNFADDLIARVPGHQPNAIVKPVSPEMVAKAMKMIKAANPQYKGRR